MFEQDLSTLEQDLLDAASALRRLHHELGCPVVHAHAFTDGRAAIRKTLRSPDRPLVTVLCATDTEAQHARTWFTGEVETLEVEEGWLVVGRAPIPADRRPVPDTRLDDLDPACVARWLRTRSAPGSTQVLGALGVLAPDGDVWRPTLAAFVVAGQNPHERVPACAVRARIDDSRITTHVGAISDLLDAVAPGRVEPWLVREALANALLHRSWSTDDPVKVRVAGDRLVVGNPGRLRRTPALAHELAVACGLLEPQQGLRQLVERLQAARLPEHSFIERDGWVWFSARLPAPARRPTPISRNPSPFTAVVPVELPKPIQAPAPTPRPSSSPPAAPLSVEPAVDRTAAVVEQIRLHGRRTTKEIAAAFGCSRPVVGKVLTRLAAEGVVRPIAAGRSPFQAYELAGGDRAGGS